MACQLRFNTSTIVLFRMSDINLIGVMEFWKAGGLLVPASLHDSTAPINPVFSVFVLCCGLLGHWSLAIGNSPTALAASPGFAPGPPVSETGALLIMQRGNWSPGKVLPLRLLGVGQTRYYFTTGRKLAAGDGFAPPTALSKSVELLVTLSRIGGAGGSCNLTIPD